MINRRSHAPRRAFRTYLCRYCCFGHFLVVIGWDADGQVPAGGRGHLLPSGNPGVASDNARPLSLPVCLRAWFSTFSATQWSHSREDGPFQERSPLVSDTGVDGEEVNVVNFFKKK